MMMRFSSIALSLLSVNVIYHIPPTTTRGRSRRYNSVTIGVDFLGNGHGWGWCGGPWVGSVRCEPNFLPIGHFLIRYFPVWEILYYPCNVR